MMRIIVASQNPVKLQAARAGFSRMFPAEFLQIDSINVISGVNHQPFGSLETLLGAKTRAENARKALPEADYWVGLEGGVEEDNGDLAAFAWIVILSKTHCGKGRTGTFYLPQAVAEWVRKGKELGEADDIVFGQTNSKQQNGAIGLLTGDVLTRAGLYEQAVILALVPFKNPEMYSPECK